MPDPVEGFTYITKNSQHFFAFVQGLTESIIQSKKLIYSRIATSKTRLKVSDSSIFQKKVMQTFVNDFLKNFAKSTDK